MHDVSARHVKRRIVPARVALVLSAIVGILAAAHGAIHLAPWLLGTAAGTGHVWWRLFHLGTEANLPTYVSALYLLFAGLLLVVVALHETQRSGNAAWGWWGLAGGVLFMSVDEAAMLHDGVVAALLAAHFGQGEGVLYYTWYLIYLPVVAGLAFVYVPFLRRLPRRYAGLFIGSGAIFLSGAIGVEMIEAYLSFSGAGGRDVSFLVEETLEMLGVVLLIYTLLTFLSERDVTLQIRF